MSAPREPGDEPKREAGETLAAPTTAPHGAAEAVAGDLACTSCGYNLRTLRFDGLCPECGAAVAMSLPGPSQTDADPQWLRTIVLGLKLLGLATLLAVVQLVLLASSDPVRSPHAHVLAWVVFVLALTALAVSMWQLAAAEPGSAPPRRVAADVLLRAAGVLTTVALLGIALRWRLAGGALLLLPAWVFLAILILGRLATVLRRANEGMLAESARACRAVLLFGVLLTGLAVVSMTMQLRAIPVARSDGFGTLASGIFVVCWIIGPPLTLVAAIATFGILVEAGGRLNRIRLESLRRAAASRADSES